jgi:integrase
MAISDNCVSNPMSAKISYDLQEDPFPMAKRLDADALAKNLTSNPIDAKNYLFGWQLSSALYFGLRVHEVCKFKPFVHLRKDCSELHVQGKGGRLRVVQLDEQMQNVAKRILEAMPQMFGPECQNHYLAPDSKAVNTLDANMQIFWRRMDFYGLTRDAIGITAHTLRKDCAVREMKKRGLEVMKFPNSIELDTSIEKELEKRGIIESEKPLTLEEEKEAMLAVAEQLGHSRLSVMRAYGRLASEVRIKNTRRLNEKQNQEFAQMYLAGTPVKQLMEAYGLSQNSVYRKAKRFGLPTPMKVAKPPESVAD